MTLALINKQDNFEIVRDQIAAILKTEIVSQQALASAAALDPNDWKLRVFSERSNPWEQFLRGQPGDDSSPLVNVSFDSSNFDRSASNVAERQKCTSVFYIDCYGAGVSSDVPGGGHKPGDQEAAFEVQKALRLVRNILMAAEYTYLGLRGLVWFRWPESVVAFQPQLDGRPIQHVVAARMALQVGFNEFSPQVQAETLELLTVQVTRSDDGEILLNANYDYTSP